MHNLYDAYVIGAAVMGFFFMAVLGGVTLFTRDR
jgi:hypothetical protein